MNDISHLHIDESRTRSARQHGEQQPLGRMLQALRGLSDQQVQDIVAYQRAHGLQFGEAAVALRLASDEEIVGLIARQFRYPCGAGSGAPDLPAELVVARSPFSDAAEIIRELRTQLVMGVMGVAEARPALAVASARSGDGKTFVAANLAAAFSQLGARTLLIDANMRRPRAGMLFGACDGSTGLSTVLAGRAPATPFRQLGALPELFILPPGPTPPNPQELLQGAAFGMLLEELRTEFDHIVIDTPASESGADFRMIAARAGASLVVARQDSTPYDALAKLVQTLGRGPGVLAGVVMNRH